MDKMKFLQDEIAQLKAENRFIQPNVLQSAQAPVCIIDGKEVINLTSNNYLCMTTHPKVSNVHSPG